MENMDQKFKKYIPYEVNFDHLEETVDFHLNYQNRKTKKKFWELMNSFEKRRAG